MTAEPGSEPGTARPPRSAAARFLHGTTFAFLALFLLSLAIQVYFLARVPERWLAPHTGRELPAISYALATSGRFADPYLVPTGPTAHLPPIPPALFALCYRLFGMDATGGRVAWFLLLAASAAAWAALPWLAQRTGLGRPAGWIAGLAGGVVPRWPGHGEGLAALALILLAGAFLARWRRGRSSAWGSLGLGAAGALACHVLPTLLLVLLGWLGYELAASGLRRGWRPAALVATGFLLVCLPWALRNLRALDALFFVRSNFGLELRMGNHPAAAAAMDVMDRSEILHRHPGAQVEEAREVARLGEVVYMRRAGREALAWIAAHPSRFARLTAERIALWWLGPLYAPPYAALTVALALLALLGAWQVLPSLTAPARAVLLLPLATFPLVHYVVAYMLRYREPLDWVLFLFAGAALWRWIGGGAGRRGECGLRAAAPR